MSSKTRREDPVIIVIDNMAKLRAIIDPEELFAAHFASPPTGLSAAAETVQDAMPSSVILEDKHGSAT